jgi:hypothetical protein
VEVGGSVEEVMSIGSDAIFCTFVSGWWLNARLLPIVATVAIGRRKFTWMCNGVIFARVCYEVSAVLERAIADLSALSGMSLRPDVSSFGSVINFLALLIS